MEEIKEAIITEDGRIICPHCKKLNGRLIGGEVVKGLRLRCRGSNGRLEHFFMLNVEREVKVND